MTGCSRHRGHVGVPFADNQESRKIPSFTLGIIRGQYVHAYLCVPPVSRSKYFVRSWIKIGSVVCLYIPVSLSVPEMEGIYATGGILFWGCTFGGVYIPCIYLHARWSYHRQFRYLLLCPLSVKRYYFHLFVDETDQLCTQKDITASATKGIRHTQHGSEYTISSATILFYRT